MTQCVTFGVGFGICCFHFIKLHVLGLLKFNYMDAFHKTFLNDMENIWKVYSHTNTATRIVKWKIMMIVIFSFDSVSQNSPESTNVFNNVKATMSYVVCVPWTCTLQFKILTPAKGVSTLFTRPHMGYSNQDLKGTELSWSHPTIYFSGWKLSEFPRISNLMYVYTSVLGCA